MTYKFLVLGAGALLVACSADVPATAAIRICEARWIDTDRGNREVPVRIRLPDRIKKAPLILFSHGLGGSLDGGRAWVEQWADAGFAVVNLQHPGSDRTVAGTGGLFRAMNASQLQARAKDVSFVINTLAAKQREGSCDLRKIDLGRIGMSGHSFGAHTTQAVAGQNLGGPDLTDARIDSAVAFSPAPPAQDSAELAFAPIRIPFFSITGSKDKVAFLPQLTPARRELPFRAMPAGGKYLLVLDGADHMDMGGPQGDGRNRLSARLRDRASHGQERRDASAQVIKHATTDFWRWTLLGDAAAKARLDATGQHLSKGDRFERK